jgi:arylsulfatase A-like enzyme
VQVQTNTALVLNVDIAPTMMELAGLTVPKEMHGRSLVPLLLGRETDPDWREQFLYEAPVPQLGSWPFYAVRTQR